MLLCNKFWTWSIFLVGIDRAHKMSPFFSISFDESLNETVKKQQMDIVVSYWDSSAQKACVQYLTSEVLSFRNITQLRI